MLGQENKGTYWVPC